MLVINAASLQTHLKKKKNVGLAYISQIGLLTQNITVIENKIYIHAVFCQLIVANK